MIRGRGVAKNIIDFAIFSGLGGTGCLSEVAAGIILPQQENLSLTTEEGKTQKQLDGCPLTLPF